MSISDSKLFVEGRAMYRAFQQMHTPAKFRPTKADIQQLARQLDLTVSYVEKRIWMFLEN